MTPARNQVKIGFFKSEITPSAETYGSFRLSGVKRHSGVHDPLFAHALVIEVEQSRCLLVSVDVVAIPTGRATALRKRLGARLKLEPAAVLLAATHTHNGPETLNEEEDPRIDVWPDIERKIVAAAEKAAGHMFEARLVFTHCELPMAINRYQHRLGMTGNTIDPRLDLLVFEDLQGRHLGVLYHYAAHPTCAMRAEHRISGDYCALANRIIESEFGGFSMFFNGACGNVNLEVGERSFQRARERASQLAAAVVGTASKSGEPVLDLQLDWEERAVCLGIKSDLAECDASDELDALRMELERIRESEWRAVIADPERQNETFRLYQKYRTTLWKKLLRERYADNPTETVPLQCIHLGPLSLVAVPGELFVEHQLWLQEQFPNRRVMTIGYANGYAGYIPTRESLACETYETQATLMHRVDGEAGARLMAAAADMVKAH